MHLFKKYTLALVFISSVIPLSAMDPSNATLTAKQLQEAATQKALDTALREAVIANDLEKAEAALFDGADPDASYYHHADDYADEYADDHDGTLCSYAETYRDTAMVELLIKGGAQLNQRIDNHRGTGCTPLHFRAYLVENSKGTSVLKLLINAEANVNAIDHEGSTPLQYILGDTYFHGSAEYVKRVQDTRTEHIRALLRAGANYTVNDRDKTVLEFAQLMQEREKRAKDGLVPKKTLQHTFDYLVDGPLSVTPLCTIFTQYADHDRPYTPAEAAQRAAAANIKQAQIKRERMEAAARRRAEQSLK